MKNAFLQPALVLLMAIMLVLIGLDQWTKHLASSLLQYNRPVMVLPVLDWTLLHNKGAAFSFLSNAGGWQRWFFTAVSIIASVVFFIWLLRLPKQQWLVRYSLSFIIAGAVGNVIDRMQFGYVVDFISVHWQQYYFPAFNIADMAITGGAMLMILDLFLHPENHK